MSALYFFLYTKIPVLQAFVNTPVGPYVHVAMVVLLIVGIFLLRTAHYPLLIFSVNIEKSLGNQALTPVNEN